MIHKGTISVVGKTDDPLQVNCEVTDQRFVIKTGDGSVVGDWTVTTPDIRRQGQHFVVEVEGERLLFVPSDPDAFATTLRGEKEFAVDDRMMPSSESSARDQLARLQGLRDEGLVTDKEYEDRRGRILDEAIATGPPPSEPPRVPPTSSERQPRHSLTLRPSLGQPKKNWSASRAWIVAAIVAGFFLVVALGSSLDSSSDDAVFVGRVVAFAAENPASLKISANITNNGNETGTFSCRLTASDPSGAYRGHGTFTVSYPLEAGATELYRFHMVITNEGASYVTKVELEYCEPE